MKEEKQEKDDLYFLDTTQINKLVGLVDLDMDSTIDTDNNIDMDNNIDIDLDIKWVEENEKIDNLYKDFYKEDVTFINMNYIYINTKNEIERIKEDKYLLSTKNLITKDEVVSIIRNNSNSNCKSEKEKEKGKEKEKDKSYSILSILKYNVSLEPEQIPLFLKEKKKNLEKMSGKISGDSFNSNKISFLTSLKKISDIYFEKTIHMFHDLNDLYFLFYENADNDKSSDNDDKNSDNDKKIVKICVKSLKNVTKTKGVSKNVNFDTKSNKKFNKTKKHKHREC